MVADVKVPVEVELARTDFGAFCALMNKPPAKHHLVWHNEFLTGKDSDQLLHCAGPNTAILAPRGPLDLNTPVATPTGWRPLKDIQLGDVIYADDGRTTTVTATVDYPDTECYRVTFSDGTSVVCDDSHRWDVRRMGTDLKGQWRTVTLQEIRCFKTVGLSGNWRTGVSRVVALAEPEEKPWLDSRGYARYQVPIPQAIDYPEQSLPLDPYVLGVLIGDGALTTGGVRFHKDDEELVDRVRSALPDGCLVSRCGSCAGSWTIRAVGGVRSKRRSDGTSNPVRIALDQLGLFGKASHEKFIPDCYLRGSLAQRIALLQGLLDTDGTCKRGTGRGEVSFTTTSRQLFDDLGELVRSLGGLAIPRKPHRGSYRKADGELQMCRMVYTCSLRLGDGVIPFHSSAKARFYLGAASGRANSGLVRSIVDIRPVGKRPVRCISIGNPSERFIGGPGISIKNSSKSTTLGMLAAWLIGVHAAESMMLRMLYLGYSLDIARSRSHTIKTLIQSKKYRQVFPMVKLSKLRQSDELWSIDYDYAGITPDADDPYSVVAQGLSGSITSRRSQLIILDDVIKSSAAIQNPQIRRQLITNWQEVVQPTLLEGGRAIALGTRFMMSDIFGTTFNEENGWRVITQQAIVTDDQGIEGSYWPGMYSLQYLQKLRREDPIAFAYQYQNRPVSQSDVDFPDDWLRLGDLTETYDAICVGIDLSSALKERSDYTVMALAGINGDVIEFIDYRRFRAMGNLEKIDALCELLSDWGVILEDETAEHRYKATDVVCTCNIEAISYQQSLRGDAKEILHDKRALHNLVLKPITGYRGDKLSRLRGTMGLFQTSRIIWNRWINWDPFWSELLNFGSAEHDDCCDAMVLAIRGLVGTGRLQAEWGSWADEEPWREPLAA